MAEDDFDQEAEDRAVAADLAYLKHADAQRQHHAMRDQAQRNDQSGDQR